MADEHDEPQKHSKRWVWFVAMPALYVLSYAPAVSFINALDQRQLFSKQTLGVLWDVWWAAYAPLNWTAHQSSWFSEFLDWYVDLIP